MSLREQKGLVENLKELIIRTLRLEDVGPEDIVASEPLFGEGLGLDSIDALELVVAIEREYQVEIPDGCSSIDIVRCNPLSIYKRFIPC